MCGPTGSGTGRTASPAEPPAPVVEHDRPGERDVERMPPMFVATLQPGDVFRHRMAGGGGWGDRRIATVRPTRRDVLEGKVTA
jgi:N-methylhydantoinase B/oxoprolinase/acetone carboxylase alpha subunit